MKKLIILSALIGLFTVITGNVAHAEESIEFETSTRAIKYKQYTFSNYPPKKHNGYTLKQAIKIKNGYIGLYN